MPYYPNKTLQTAQQALFTAEQSNEIHAEFTNLADVPEYLKRDDYLFYIASDSTYYKWNSISLTWEAKITGNGGVVDAVSAGTNIAITGTADVPIISTIANPNFNTVTLTTQSAINHATRKDYVDTADALNLKIANNLSDLNNVATARTNLNVYDKSTVYTKTEVNNLEALDLKIANNLSDLSNFVDARTNLDVYSKTEIDNTETLNLKVANDLGDVNNVANARTNLSVYSMAEVDNLELLDLKIANNLSDLSSAALARDNLSVYSKAQLITLNDANIERFYLTYYGSRSYPSLNFWSDSPTNSIVGISAGQVRPPNYISDLGPPSFQPKLYDITQYLTNVSSGIITVQPYQATGFSPTIWTNIYQITGISSSPDANKYMEYSVTPISVTHTYTTGEELIVSIKKATIGTASDIITTGSVNYATSTNLQTNINQLDNQLFATTTTTNGKVSSVTNTDGKLVISGTAINPIIDVQQNFRWGNGAYRGLVYEMASGFGTATQIATNATIISSISQMSIGFSSFNGGSDADIASSTQTALEYIKDNLPYTVRVIDTTNTSNHFTLTLNSYAGASGSAYLFNVSYVSTQTNITNIPTLGTKCYLLFDHTGISNKTAITTHINNTTGAHAGTAISTNTTGYYITASTVQNNLSQLDTRANTDAVNIASLQVNKLDTLTAGNNFLTITGTGTSRTLTTRSNAYLSGTVNITNAGLLTLGGVSQTGHPFVSSGSTMTVYDDLIIDGTFTMASNSNLVVVGNLVVLGTVTISATTTITCNGIINFMGKTSADTFSCTTCTFNTYDEFAIRNYTSSAYVNFLGTNAINAKSFTFQNNTASLFFDNTSSHTMTVSDILFANNSNASSGVGFNGSTIRLQNITINATSVKFLNNTSINYACDLRQNVTINANIIEFTSNVNTVSGAYTVYMNTSIVLNADKLLFQNNTHSADIAVIAVTSSVTLTSKNILLLNNVGNTYGFYTETGSTINSDYIHIKTNGATQNIMQKGNVYGLYTTTRTPQYIIDNTGATITGFNNDSFLGIIPMAWKTYSNPGAPHVESTNNVSGNSKLNPLVFTYGENTNTVSDQFSDPSNSGITYVGKDNTFLQLIANFSFKTASTVTQDYCFEIYKNGSTLYQNSRQYVSSINTAGYSNTTLECILVANPNDFFQLSVYISNVNGGPNPVNLSFIAINWSLRKCSVM